MIPSFTPVILTSDRETLQLHTSAGRVVGTLEPRHSRILQVLRDDEDVELQAYVVSPLPQELLKGKAKKSFKNLTLSLSVILYGPMEVFEAIADFLEHCSEFLQCPLHCDRNVPYRNPQSLSAKDHNAPMTYQLEADLRHSQIETIVQGPDPSAALEAKDALQETEAPSSIKTSLYR